MNSSLPDMFLLSLLSLYFPPSPPSCSPYLPQALKGPQSELTLPPVHTHVHAQTHMHAHLVMEVPTTAVHRAQRQASGRLRAHSHLTGSSRQPGGGLWQSPLSMSDLKAWHWSPGLAGPGKELEQGLANAWLASGGEGPCQRPGRAPGSSVPGQLETRAALTSLSLGPTAWAAAGATCPGAASAPGPFPPPPSPASLVLTAVSLERGGEWQF